jgi:inositol-phosphate phosphatase/L-galactose 1-phosphate phosphatase
LLYSVDPIDGTTNFVHNYPFVAVSIGYIHDSIPRVGVVYNPYTDSLYEAAEGSGVGTLLNGQPVRIDSVATSIEDCLLVNNIGHYRHPEFVDESAERVRKWLRAGLRGYRASGSAAQNLAHVASGQVSCYYEHGYGGPWDVCAGMVLVREAGGVVWDATESSSLQLHFGKGSVCAGGKRVVEDVLRVAGKPTFTFTKG